MRSVKCQKGQFTAGKIACLHKRNRQGEISLPYKHMGERSMHTVQYLQYLRKRDKIAQTGANKNSLSSRKSGTKGRYELGSNGKNRGLLT